DTQFTVGFVDHTGFKGQGRKHQAYLYASNATTSSYHPPMAYRFNTSGKASTVQHLGKGRYLVTLPGQPAGGAAEVSTRPANVADLGLCQVRSIRTNPAPAQIGVACTDFDGTPKNEQFVLAFTH